MIASRTLLLIGIFASALFFERLFPLRRVTQPKANRAMTNFILGGLSSTLVQLSLYPVLLALADLTSRNGFGLIPRLGLPAGIQLLVTLLCLDWTLYLWHRLNHRVSPLWRFHNVHHTDLDMDVTTAARFHFGELSLATVWGAAQILFLGVNAETWLTFQILVTSCAQFHHSNIRLPLPLERVLNWWVVTPRMHGVHHSTFMNETDSNYSTILSVWDRVHRSLNLTPAQSEITIGVPAYENAQEVTLLRSLALPFRAQRDWPARLKVRAVNPKIRTVH
jgi:sterol desaturase/sphingolipid hydroxylase (fatty acid hydroxylase superfamily)